MLGETSHLKANIKYDKEKLRSCSELRLEFNELLTKIVFDKFCKIRLFHKFLHSDRSFLTSNSLAHASLIETLEQIT